MSSKFVIIAVLALLGFAAPAKADLRNYPSDEVGNYVAAVERAAYTRAAFDLAEDNFNATVRDVQRKFENSDEYKKAFQAEKDAYKEYQEARADALKPLKDDAHYQALIKLRDDVSKDIEVYRERKTSPEAMMPYAGMKLQYNQRIREMESERIDIDTAVKEAREKLVEAGKRLSQLKSEFAENVRNDKGIKAAKQEMEESRIEMIAAAARLRAAKEAADSAVDHSYQQDDHYSDYDHDWFRRRRPWYYD